MLMCGVPVAHRRCPLEPVEKAAPSFRYLVTHALSITEGYFNAIRLLVFQSLMENFHFFPAAIAQRQAKQYKRKM